MYCIGLASGFYRLLINLCSGYIVILTVDTSFEHIGNKDSMLNEIRALLCMFFDIMSCLF